MCSSVLLILHNQQQYVQLISKTSPLYIKFVIDTYSELIIVYPQTLNTFFFHCSANSFIYESLSLQKKKKKRPVPKSIRS